MLRSPAGCLTKSVALLLLIGGFSLGAYAQNNGNNGNRGNSGNGGEGPPPHARNQRWVKQGGDILHSFPLDTKVGVGLSNPALPFEVGGESRFHSRVGFADETMFLNALQLPNGIWTSSGNVGIGTDTPAYQLDVIGESRFDGPALFTRQVDFQEGADFNQPASFSTTVNMPGQGVWLSDGRVGIGTTEPVYNLDVVGNSRFGQKTEFGGPADFAGAVTLQQTLTVDGLTHLAGDASLGAALSVTGEATFEGESTFNSASGFLQTVSFVQGVWDSQGRVGIGTATPQQVLDVSGDARVTGPVEFGDTGSFAGNLSVGQDLEVTGSSRFVSTTDFEGAASFGNEAVFGNTTLFSSASTFNGPLILPGQGIWTGEGNVGIGIQNPERNLDVAGSARFGGVTEFGAQGTFMAGVQVGQQLEVQGTASFLQPVSFAGDVTIGSTLVLGEDLAVTGTTVFSGDSRFAGPATFEETVGFAGSLGVSQDLTVEGSATLTGTSRFMSRADFGAAIAVAGASLFESAGTFQAGLTAFGASRFDGAVQFSNGVWSADGRLVIGATTAAESYLLQVKGPVDAEELYLNGVPVREAVALWQEQETGDLVFTDGNIGIGTSAPDPAYRLSINGKVRSKEVVVEADWADFVFEEHYDLPTLDEVEAFIQANGHLPGIPSEEEVVEEGIGVGAIQAKLLQKIEELTLYVIELNKELKNAKNENGKLRKLIKTPVK